jgi:hypothetical protein
MARNFPTPRHLDDPTRFSGLTLAQWGGLLLGGLCSYLAWLVVGPAGPWVTPLSGVWGLGLRVFCAGLVGALAFMAVYVLAGTPPMEPLGRQYWGYLWRPHRYRPDSTTSVGTTARARPGRGEHGHRVSRGQSRV